MPIVEEGAWVENPEQGWGGGGGGHMKQIGVKSGGIGILGF